MSIILLASFYFELISSIIYVTINSQHIIIILADIAL